MAHLSFPVKKEKELVWRRRNEWKLPWNVKCSIVLFARITKVLQVNSCALSIYKQVFAYVVQSTYSISLITDLQCWNHWENFCMCIYDTSHMYVAIVLSVDPDDRLPGLRSWCHHVMGVWIWASFLTSLYLRCFICKMRMMIIFTSWRLLNSELFNTYKAPRKVSVKS